MVFTGLESALIIGGSTIGGSLINAASSKSKSKDREVSSQSRGELRPFAMCNDKGDAKATRDYAFASSSKGGWAAAGWK